MFKIHQSKAQGKFVDVTYEPLIIIRVKLTESCQIRLALGSVQLMGLLWCFDYESRNLPCFKIHYLSLFSSKHQTTRRLSTRREASTGLRVEYASWMWLGRFLERPMKMDWYTNKRFGMSADGVILLVWALAAFVKRNDHRSSINVHAAWFVMTCYGPGPLSFKKNYDTNS